MNDTHLRMSPVIAGLSWTAVR